MKKIWTLIYIFLFISTTSYTSAQNLIQISGKIIDNETKETIPGVTIRLKGATIGTISNSDGFFTLHTNHTLPLQLTISGVGFKTHDFEIKQFNEALILGLDSQILVSDDVVVSASRVEEKILRSPVAIEKLDIRSLKESPAPTFYEALDNTKGIQLTTSSLNFKVPNARGFNIPNNFRFMQLVDGVDVQAATLGVPLGNAIGPTELDIASIEVTPGAASALYGMNAVNGLASLQTKNPFNFQGFSFYQRTGVNHVNSNSHDVAPLTETAFRYAKAWNNKLAFKINASFLQGTDWISNTLEEQNPNTLSSANPRFQELNASTDNPASDLWNRYGDERNNRTTVSIQYQGKTQIFNVARTGYLEKDLTDPSINNTKVDAGLFYRLNPNLELSYSYRYGLLDGLFQRGNKVRLDDVSVQNHRVELKGKGFFVRAYGAIEDTGKSYNLKPLTDNLDLNNGSNAQWATRFQTALQSAVNSGVPLATAFKTARTAADQGRVEPGTTAFEQLKNTIIGINNWDIAVNVAGAPVTGGAWLKQRSNLYHLDGQWDLSKRITFADILIGFDYRLYEVVPDGNNFVDFSRPLAERTVPLANGSFGKNQTYTKYGAFAQITKRLFQDKLKINTSIRIDQNPEFSPKLNPRIALVYSPSEYQNIRISAQNGWRFPALFEALSFVNNGNVRRVGGLARVNEGIGYNENSYTLASVDNFTSAVSASVAAGKSKNQAALDNRALLVQANLPSLRPENINAFEVGYKSLLADQAISLDWDTYYNVYNGFLGQVEVAVPKTDKVGTDASVLDMLTRSKQDRYRVFTNAKNTYHSFGSALGIGYNFHKKYLVSGNVSYNNIKSNTTSDIFVTAFNTPKWVTNLSFGNREIVKNIGFNVVARWQDAFRWESPLANGDIPAFTTIDAQVNVRIPAWKTTLKVGGSNLLNKPYIQYAAGPTIGGLYYLTLTFDGGSIK
jgi:outer membrane receptor protein involved in Fe transport